MTRHFRYLLLFLMVLTIPLASLAERIVNQGGIVIDGETVYSPTGNQPSDSEIKTKTLNPQAFNNIDILLTADVIITQGQQHQITLKAPEHILALLSANIENETLILSSLGNYATTQAVQVFVDVVLLETLRLYGAGDAQLNIQQQPQVKIHLFGSGSITATGEVSTLIAALEGAGELDLEALRTKNSEVLLSGAGDISVWATDTLNAHLSGAGDITVYGSPTTLKQIISGAGDITVFE